MFNGRTILLTSKASHSTRNTDRNNQYLHNNIKQLMRFMPSVSDTNMFYVILSN